jgi:hypothetical protein
MKKQPTARMILTEDVWHGYTRPAGTIVELCVAPVGDADETIVDDCGHAAVWVTDPYGKKLEVWPCEMKPVSRTTHSELANYIGYVSVEFRYRSHENGYDDVWPIVHALTRELYRRQFSAKMAIGKEAARLRHPSSRSMKGGSK